MAETKHAPTPEAEHGAQQATGHQHGGHRDRESSAELRVGILTCSDRGSRGERADVSGPTIHNLVVDRLGGKVAQYKVVPDDRAQIEQTLIEWVDEERLDLIFTTGGTGFSPRDVTPEATRAVVEREAPAITQAMLFESLRITPYAMLTRATAGIRRRTLIVNLPGNPKAVNENFDAVAEVLPHAVDVIKGVDTHAAHAGHGGDANHGSHSSHGEPRHDGHAAHQQHGGDEERRHEAHAGHERHEDHQGHREPAAAPAAAGIARNVGGPTC